MDSFNLHSSRDGSPSPELRAMPTSLEELRELIQGLREELLATMPSNQLTTSQVQDLLKSLPRLTEDEVIHLGHKESLCPICLNPLLSILAEEDIALAMDSPAHPVEDLGITKLSEAWQCGHIFCRRDISKWISEAHDSCPMCRHLLVPPDTNGNPAEAPSQDPNDPLADISMQMLDHIALLRSQIRVTPLYEPEENVEVDRNEFSGMYS